MIEVQHFSTADVQPRRKIDFWNALAYDTFTPMEVNPLDPESFDAKLMRADIGALSFAEPVSAAAVIRHLPAHVAKTKAAVFFLHLQLEGSSTYWQDGHTATLHSGDFTLCDNTRPYELAFNSPNRTLVVGIPRSLMLRHLGYAESVVAIPINGNSPLGGSTSRFLRELWNGCCNGEPITPSPSLDSAILSLLASMYVDRMGGRMMDSSLVSDGRLRVVNYIETHLSNPHLTPTRIAKDLQISLRYVHRLMEQQSETVGQYILRRRLEECARLMVDLAHRRRTLASIALEHCFSSRTYFARAFRKQYGRTPREYRREATLARGPTGRSESAQPLKAVNSRNVDDQMIGDVRTVHDR